MPNDMIEKLHHATREELLKVINAEIADHDEWCGPNCQTFLPQVYRDRRLRGDSAKSLQGDYDSCHIFR